MLRLAFLLIALVVACIAAPGDRAKRYYHDGGLGYGGHGGGGHGGGYGGYGYGPGGHGLGYGAHTVPVSQSFSKSSASSTSISGGGSYGRK